jgi:hypothetical protein
MKTQATRNHRVWLPVLAAILVPAMAHAQSRSGASLHDGVVVDPAAGAAYVTSPNGDVVAIELTGGTRRWASGIAARPLAVTDGTLVVQAAPGPDEQLVVVSIDKQDGDEKVRSKIALPGNLKANTTNSVTQKTMVEGTLDPTGDVVVTWAIESRIARGAQPDDGSTEAVLGAVRIDPETGQSVIVPVTPEPDNGAVSNLSPRQMTEVRSLDGQHILRSERSSDPTAVAMPYRWTITTATGEMVGVVEAATSASPFVVNGSQLLHVAQASGYRDGSRFVTEPLRLRAVDLASGAQLWTVPVLDATSVIPPP